MPETLKSETRNLEPLPGGTATDGTGGAAPRGFWNPKRFVLFLAIVLFFLHQDYWNWTDSRLVFGFLPVGLAYHALFSIAAALLGAYAIRVAWPKDVEAWAEEENDAT